MTATVQPMIATPDLERLAAYYRDLLGATESQRVPDEGPTFFVELAIGDSELGVVADAEADLEATPRMLLSIGVSDVDSLLPRVRELGGVVLSPPHDMPWGQRVAHTQDPDGNAVNLCHPI